MFADPQAYDQFMGRWSGLLAPRFLDFADIPAAGRALDVGPGTGSLAFAIADRMPGRDVLGIEPSPGYAAYATHQNRAGSRIKFEVGSAERLPFADGMFTSSLSSLVLNFIPNPRTALQEMIRVTEPNGRIASAVWDYGFGMRMLRLFWDAAVRIAPTAEALDEKRMPLCRSGELSDLWKQAGLVEVDEQAIEITMHFSSFADYWDPFLMGQGPAGAFARRLEPDQLEMLRKEVKLKLNVSAEDASFDLPARAWTVRGTVPSGA